MEDYFSVTSEIVVVTGAGGQLGIEYCRAFLAAGARVVGLDLHESQALSEVLIEHSDRFIFSRSDVTNVSDLRHSLFEIISRFGIPTVLVNNAAIDSPPDASIDECGPFETYPDASFDRVMDVNVKGVYLCCKIFGGEMAKSGRGSIINVSSIYGVLSPDQSIYRYRRDRGETFFKPVAYSVSKSAILNLTRYLAVYWAKCDVRVNNLVISGVLNGQEKEFLDAYCSRIPIGRMAGKSDYNGAVLFLASAASAYMTGATLTVDGGWTAI